MPRSILGMLLLLAAVLAACHRPRPEPVTSPTRFYDFRFGEQPAGYFEITDDGDEIRMNAVFAIDGEVCENPFTLRYAGDRVTAYQIGDGPWQVVPPDRYPTSAYPLLVPRVRERMVHQAIREGDGSDLGETVLVRDGDIVTETRGGQVVRVFRLDAQGAIVAIDWGGGATSTLRADRAAAVAGSPLAK